MNYWLLVVSCLFLNFDWRVFFLVQITNKIMILDKFGKLGDLQSNPTRLKDGGIRFNPSTQPTKLDKLHHAAKT